MLKQALTGMGLAIGATLLSVSQVLAADFFIDTFNNQFTTGFTTNQPNPITPTSNLPQLRTGTSFPTSIASPGFINNPIGTLPSTQVIGGTRDLQMFSVLNQNNLGSSGSSRVITSGSGFWQVATSGGSRVSSSMIWDNINPSLPPTTSNSGRFADRFRRGSLAFQTLQVVPGTINPNFQNIFTFVLKDSFGNESRVSRSAITSNQFVFITFEEFRAASNFLLDLNAINYVELNIVTGGGNSSTVRVDFVRGFEIPEPSLVLGLGIVFCVGYLSTKGSRVRMLENEDSL